MNCPRCGAWTNVLATRGATRRRECGNGHRFTTVEVVPSVVRERDYATHLRAAAGRATRHRRDLRIVEDARGASAVAREHGLTEARVRQIRAAARKEGPS